MTCDMISFTVSMVTSVHLLPAAQCTKTLCSAFLGNSDLSISMQAVEQKAVCLLLCEKPLRLELTIMNYTDLKYKTYTCPPPPPPKPRCVGPTLGCLDPDLDASNPTWVLGPLFGCLDTHFITWTHTWMLGPILGPLDPNLDAWYPTWMLGPPLECLVPHLDACYLDLDACYPDLDAWYFTWILGTSLLCLLSHLVWTLMYQENAQA